LDFRRSLDSPLSALVLRPAFDRLAVPAIARFYLPLSRAWAAGLAAGGDADSLLSAAPQLAGRPRVAERALRRLVPRAREFATASTDWEAAFFGAREQDPVGLALKEERRVRAAQALMLGRLDFLSAHLVKRFPAIAWAMAGKEEVTRRHGQRLSGPGARFPLAHEPPAMEKSRVIEGPGFDTHWLRARTSVGGNQDTLWARVERPHGAGPHPVLIFTHGIFMENEFWQEPDSPAKSLAASGLAVIRPEGPYHGRRRVAGSFGGEQVMAHGPMGLLDYFEAHVRELGMLTGWARQTFGGPVAVGGVSLGALAAQLVAGAAGHWPTEMRPDAFFLVTTSDSMVNVALEGSLPLALGASRMLADHGWSRESLAHWHALLDPIDGPTVAPDKVVMVLGQRDEITPYAKGQRLVRRWGVPEANVFLRDLGHFTTSLGLYRDPAPFARLRAVMAAA
jgi:hypothetical protein